MLRKLLCKAEASFDDEKSEAEENDTSALEDISDDEGATLTSIDKS